MYAIVDIAGQQFKVEKNQKVFVHRLEDKEGSKVTFDKVLLIENGDKITVGEPVVKGATVSAKVVSHLKGDKVIVFKKKRRKGYQKSNGHRQYLTELLIDDISTTAKKAPAAKKEEVSTDAKAEAKTEAKAAPAKKAPAEKKAAAPKAEAKKAPAAKKAAAPKKDEPKKED